MVLHGENRCEELRFKAALSVNLPHDRFVSPNDVHVCQRSQLSAFWTAKLTFLCL